MNNKKIQAQMQVNVSFLGNTAQLLKQLQDTTKQLNLDSSLYKPLAASLSKGFKEAFDNLNQMTSGLSKKGLSTKQYTDFFNDINSKLNVVGKADFANVTSEDMNAQIGRDVTITDTIGRDFTYVEGSASEGVTVTNGIVT